MRLEDPLMKEGFGLICLNGGEIQLAPACYRYLSRAVTPVSKMTDVGSHLEILSQVPGVL